jgi:hypothetical protein
MPMFWYPRTLQIQTVKSESSELLASDVSGWIKFPKLMLPKKQEHCPNEYQVNKDETNLTPDTLSCTQR